MYYPTRLVISLILSILICASIRFDSNPTIDGSLAKLTGPSCIFDNHLNGPIPEEIGHLRSLTKLSLGTNFLNSSIPASLGNLTSLLFLYLHDNHLSSSIPKQLGYLRFWAAVPEGAIPQCLGNMGSHLEVLDIHRNKLQDSFQQLLELGVLRTFDLHDNKLEENPSSLGKRKELQVVD
ncbi:hypothetical protein HAX54_051111 [Datura stramonium]|uniref:Uncharacterized protein n=1 Tax=Datura stramonium TaxID=4076 RepID=A0ABS8SXB3_DATST|nr:hypothetical protein [Datura stramonium]